MITLSGPFVKEDIPVDTDGNKIIGNWNRIKEPVPGAIPWIVHLMNKKWRYKENFAKLRNL